MKLERIQVGRVSVIWVASVLGACAPMNDQGLREQYGIAQPPQSQENVRPAEEARPVVIPATGSDAPGAQNDTRNIDHDKKESVKVPSKDHAQRQKTPGKGKGDDDCDPSQNPGQHPGKGRGRDRDPGRDWDDHKRDHERREDKREDKKDVGSIGHDDPAQDPAQDPAKDPSKDPGEPGWDDWKKGCGKGTDDSLCLGIKYVVFEKSPSENDPSKLQARKNLQAINQIWNQCQIGFGLDHYLSVDPGDFKLPYYLSHSSEIAQVRETFGSEDSLLVVTTGEWNREGSLGASFANAWTAMPGELLHGAVLERSVESFPGILAHELGHYLGLGHVSELDDVMHSVVYADSVHLTATQCSAAKWAAGEYWKKAIRQ